MVQDLAPAPAPTHQIQLNPRCPRCEKWARIIQGKFAICPWGCRSDVGKALYWRSEHQWVYLNARAKETRDTGATRVLRGILRAMAEEPAA